MSTTAIRVLVRDIVINHVVSAYWFPRGLRWRALRALGMPVERSSINAGAFFGGMNIHIGAEAFINYRAFLDNAAAIWIGERVSFGPNVTLLTGTHEIGTPVRRAGHDVALPVRICDGAWLGSNVTVLPGVSIGSGAVVAAGAVVVDDCVANGLYAGVPARLIRTLEDAQPSRAREDAGSS